mmetsp:Transcript_64460/g.185278  ORF Transcript_64460/g.185278 Transcript_64460/m.185278 type:complete len:177 (-) Transcript_64460:251-781(-)
MSSGSSTALDLWSSCRDPVTCVQPAITCCAEFAAVTMDIGDDALGFSRSVESQTGGAGMQIEDPTAPTKVDAEAEALYFRRLEECSRLAREEECRQRLEEKERLRQEKADEAASRDAREHARWEREEVAAFLKVHGFAHVQAKQKKWLRSFYPLHVAVEENNAEALSYLLRAGADK